MKTILVIEDEETVRENLIDLLEVENFYAIAASNGQIGVNLAQQHQPDLIICDIMMPELDGYGVLQELKRDPLTAMIPLIFLTAKDDRTSLRQGMDLGADDYVTKPCTPAELLRAITSRLEKQAVYMQHYSAESERAKALQHRVQELQQLSNSRDDLLQKLSQELRDPLSNITMAIQMLEVAPSKTARDRYLKILRDECAREITLLNQLTQLRDFLTPENLTLLRRFNLLQNQRYEKDLSH